MVAGMGVITNDEIRMTNDWKSMQFSVRIKLPNHLLVSNSRGLETSRGLPNPVPDSRFLFRVIVHRRSSISYRLSYGP